MRKLAGLTVSVALIQLLLAANAVSLAYQLIQPSELSESTARSPELVDSHLSTATDHRTVTITDESFSPAVITTTMGTEIAWINQGTGPHGVALLVEEPEDRFVYLPLVINGAGNPDPSSDAWPGISTTNQTNLAWSSGTLQPGGAYRRVFNQEGTFQYLNPFHPDMLGTVVVVAPNQPPTIQTTVPQSGAILGPGPLTVSGLVADDEGGLVVTVNGANAAVAGGTFEANISPASGNQTIVAEVRDKHGLSSHHAIVVTIDGEAPAVEITSPKNGQSVYALQPTITASYTDFKGPVATASVAATLQARGTAAVDITSGLTVTPSGLSGQPPGPLTADTVYTLTVTASDAFGNQASQTSAFYVPDDPAAFQPPIAGEQSGWVSGRVYDSSTCDLDLVTCRGLAGALVTLESVDLPLMAAVRQQRQNQVLSELLSAGGFRPVAPLESSVATTPISGTVVTGPDGFFAFPAEATGTYWLRVEKPGYTYGQREIDIVRERSTATNPIYLTPEDSAVTPCDNAGCSHVNSDDTLRLDIPPGAIGDGQTAEMRATWFSNVEFLPSGELPENTWETYAFDLSAGREITFTTPVTVLVRNERGFAPGTPIPVGYWNQFTQAWEHVGVSHVDITGEWLVHTTTHFSPFDHNLPIFEPEVEITVEQEQPDDPNNQDPTAGGPEDKKDEPCTAGTSGCFVGLKSGILQEWFDVPPVQVLGESEAPKLHYSTGRANRTELIDARVVMNSIGTSFLKDYITFELYISGERTEIQYLPVMTQTLGELGRYRYLWDGVDAQGQPMPPGVYDYTVKFIIPYTAEYCRSFGDVFGGPPECSAPLGVFTDGEIELVQGGTVILDGEPDGGYGEGWVLQGQQRLYENERGQIVIMDGVRHDEFYFPQKNLLLTDTLTISAATAYAQYVERGSGDVDTLTGNERATATEASGPVRPSGHEELPDITLVYSQEAPPYEQARAADQLATNVCGALNGTITWNLPGSPYVVTCDVLVNPGASLTIEPGAG
jgi:plastocyanin